MSVCQKSCQCKDLNIEYNQNDRNALFTLENYGSYNNHFYGTFSAGQIFSGGFLVNAENIQLGG